MIEAIYMVDVEKMPKFRQFNLSNLKKKMNVLLVTLPVSGSFLSAIQTVFMRCYTINIQMPEGEESIQTYAYFVQACLLALFQLKYIYLFLNLYQEV